MTRDQIITLVLGRLGNRTSDSVLTAAAVLEIQALQEWYEQQPELPWFLMSEASTNATVSGENRIQLPANFLLEPEEGALWYVDSDGTRHELAKADYDDVVLASQGDPSGPPTMYAIRGLYFYLGPVPDAVYTIEMIYLKKGELLDTNIENVWTKNASQLMIAGLGRVLAGDHLHNAPLAERYARNEAGAWKALLDQTTAREMANRDLYMEDA